MTEAQILLLIQTVIIANGNNEITADVLRPVLIEMLQQPNALIGDLDSLQTSDKTNLVNAINEVLGTNTGGLTVLTGTTDPNVTPPSGTINIGDFYVWNDGTLKGFYQYNGVEWAIIKNLNIPNDLISSDAANGVEVGSDGKLFVNKFSESIPIENTYATIDGVGGMLDSQTQQTTGFIQKVLDASFDGIVGIAYYEKKASSTADLSDYDRITGNPFDPSEITVQWNEITGDQKDVNLSGFTNDLPSIAAVNSVTADDGGIDNTDPLNPIFQSSLFQKKSEKGAANGYTPLGSDQKVPAQYLPSYVDDVIDGYYTAPTFYSDVAETIPIVGETGKVYIDLKTNRSYRWSGSVYARVDDFDLTAALSNAPAKAVPIGADRIPLLDSVTGFLRNFTLTNLVTFLGAYFATKTQYHEFACSDETSDLEAGTVYEQRLLRAFTNCTRFDFGVIEVPTGSKIIIDVHKNGTTIFSTKPSIDISGNRTIGAAVQQVISGGSVSFAVGDIIKVIIDQVGSTAPGKNLKAQITYNS